LLVPRLRGVLPAHVRPAIANSPVLRKPAPGIGEQRRPLWGAEYQSVPCRAGSAFIKKGRGVPSWRKYFSCADKGFPLEKRAVRLPRIPDTPFRRSVGVPAKLFPRPL
jgi:hypothetical protein